MSDLDELLKKTYARIQHDQLKEILSLEKDQLLAKLPVKENHGGKK